MPISARKSSLGASRRGQQKYIPYRADDFQRGKRTGIAVGVVEHNSDEFEPFEEVLKQADARTPPRPKIQRKKKKQPKTPVMEEPEYDENGEMSMDLEDSTPNSPAMYFSNARVSTITSSVQREGSSSRPVHRSSDVDFDEVPSPRRPVSALSNNRHSLPIGRSPGPSRLSVATLPQDLAEGIDVDDNFDDGGYDRIQDDDSDNEPMASRSPSPALSRRLSFTQMDQDEEEEHEEEQELDEEVSHQTPTSSKAKGKQREIAPPDEDEDMPDAFETGFDDGDVGLPDIQEEPEEPDEDREETPKPKKGRGRPRKESMEDQESASKQPNNEEPKPKRKPKKNVLRDLGYDSNQLDASGIRRGTRTRYAPLDWWRLEKVVYGRRESGPCLVPNIKEIHRIPKEEPVPLGGKKSRKRSRAKSVSQSVEPDEPIVYNPEEGWDDKTEQIGVVHDFEKDQDVEKRVAYTAAMLDFKPAANNDFYFQKVFGDGNFIAAGQLVIPPRKQKPTKGTKDNTFVFYIIEGAVNVKIHRSSFILTSGGMFLVPRGNMYFIQDISDRDAKLFFAQARKMPDLDDGNDQEDRPSTSRSPSKDRRSESVKRAMSEMHTTATKTKPKKRAESRA